MVDTIEVTVREAYKALAKNGFEHLRGAWVTQNEDGTILGGCALGQMGVNLGVTPSTSVYGNSLQEPYSLISQLDRFFIQGKDIEEEFIVTTYLNDDSDRSIQLGSLIVYLNDAKITGHYRGGTWVDDSYFYSWKQIVSAAQRYMKPYFDEVLTLAVYKFGVANA